MDNWIPLVSALVGALIGSLTSIVTLVVQSRVSSRRERAKLSVEAGVAEFKLALEAVQKSGGGRVAPLTAYIFYNSRVIELIEAGRLRPGTLKRLNQDYQDLVKVISNGSGELHRD